MRTLGRRQYSPANATIPPEFLKKLARNAQRFYATLNKTNLFFDCLSVADREASRDPDQAHEADQ